MGCVTGSIGARAGLAVLDLERVAAATGGGDVRVVDLEPGLLQAVEEVDAGTLEIRRAERVDDDPDAVCLELVVALLGTAIEAERVLEARAAPALDGDAKNVGVAGRLVGLELLDLRGSALGQRNECRRLFDCRQGSS